MTDWTAGYVADIGYTYGYYTELNSLHMRLAFLQAGVALPNVVTACELGFGQGISTNFHAAASQTQWYGTDFNPAQTGYARSLCEASGSGAQLFDQGFDEFCQRDDLPEFDYIALHGIWSWISDNNRAIIVDFIRRKLKVGGVLYISYNTQPGWAAMVPLRDLLTTHSEVMGSAGQGLVPRIDSALAFADKLFATQPRYAQANPLVAERLRQLKEQNRNYLAHEYFNRDWLPMPFSRMVDWLSPCKLNYVTSANYIEHIDALNLTAEQQNLLNDIHDPLFRETVRDFCINQQFRRDLWVKGARKLSTYQQEQQLKALRVVLIQPRPGVSMKLNSALGEVAMQETVYGPILDLLGDHQARSLEEIYTRLQPCGIQWSQLIQAVQVLCGTGTIGLANSSEVSAACRTQVQRLNAYLCEQACGGHEVIFLASPVTGGGVNVAVLHQIFLHARAQGLNSLDDWAKLAWRCLSQQGKRLLRDGQTLESVEDNLAELRLQAQTFSQTQLPILQALQIA